MREGYLCNYLELTSHGNDRGPRGISTEYAGNKHQEWIKTPRTTRTVSITNTKN